jgi:hypothetical protein
MGAVILDVPLEINRRPFSRKQKKKTKKENKKQLRETSNLISPADVSRSRSKAKRMSQADNSSLRYLMSHPKNP